jgi:hypothetical protein
MSKKPATPGSQSGGKGDQDELNKAVVPNPPPHCPPSDPLRPPGPPPTPPPSKPPFKKS